MHRLHHPAQVPHVSGSFIALIDEDGMRHLVRQGAILALSDADDARDTTIAQLPAGRSVTIRAPLEDVLVWFSLPWVSSPTPSHARADVLPNYPCRSCPPAEHTHANIRMTLK